MTNLREQLAGHAKAVTATVSFARDIAPLFNATDIAHMKQVTHGSLDLSNYGNVKIWAQQIYSRVSSGDMPPAPAPAWPPSNVQLFAAWIAQGTPP
ncbi:hypothetical protein KR767_19090 [Luteibacter anthropi]|uniref:hypothetical protein n=1 Tax=Luteibacter anthropi TaxID=564369 RepID=UPI002032D606|nr:hypothetical protein [Luteibacter anthropi]URX62126.1 hypothetical protein KR767_19090 [Luteibacter anthropi]